jgi:hypothetical protein
LDVSILGRADEHRAASEHVQPLAEAVRTRKIRRAQSRKSRI